MFQREVAWFLDESADGTEDAPAAASARSGGAARIPLEPGFLFSKELLQSAIPELLTQTGTSGRQFAHLLIRSHQEMSRNDFPDLERSAERVGERRFPLSVDDLMGLATQHGLQLRWFDRRPAFVRDKDQQVRSIVRSFFESPGTVYLNRALRTDPARLKFDLATHIGHKVLHGGDGMKSAHATGGEMGGSPEGGADPAGLRAQDVLHAWRDFECSFFAGALLCPKIPFRRFLARERYRVESAAKIELTPAVVMRRMTKVSPYPYWHFFDAYPPGYLRAVYRGNGIPLPWGNMARASDPCPQWAVFRMIGGHQKESGSQISVLRDRCSTAATRCARATWQATRTCFRSASIWRRCWTPTARTPRRSSPVLPRIACAGAPMRRFHRLQPARCAPRRACSTLPGSKRHWNIRHVSSVRAARIAHGRTVVKVPCPRARAKSPIFAPRYSERRACARSAA